MEGHSSHRGNSEKEFIALMKNASIDVRTRLLFHEALKQMNSDFQRVEVYCENVGARANLWEFDCLSEENSREQRPWAALCAKEGKLILLHARPFTGGIAERESARSEAVVRFNLEFPA